eukprot:6199573-Pleurochrysis_carterae.AAC.1
MHFAGQRPPSTFHTVGVADHQFQLRFRIIENSSRSLHQAAQQGRPPDHCSLSQHCRQLKLPTQINQAMPRPATLVATTVERPETQLKAVAHSAESPTQCKTMQTAQLRRRPQLCARVEK